MTSVDNTSSSSVNQSIHFPHATFDDSPENTGNCTSDLYRHSRDFMFYSLSLIVPIGLLTNSVSLAVFMTSFMRRRASSWYLAALAVSDNASLLAIMLDYWLKNERVGLHIMRTSQMACISITHLSYTSRLLSAWLVTTFTVERFIGVVFPLRRSSLVSTSHSKRMIVLEAVLALLLSSFTIFTIGIVEDTKDVVDGKDCDVLPNMANVYVGFNIVFLIFGSIVAPVLIIVALNLAILNKVKHRGDSLPSIFTWAPREAVNQTLRGTATRGYRPGRRNSMQQELRRRHQYRDYGITSVLVIVSVTFVVLNIPYCLCWFVAFFARFHVIGQTTCDDKQAQLTLYAVKYISSVPYFLNYGLNFVLYSLCARAFRRQLGRVFASCFRCFSSNKSRTPIHHIPLAPAAAADIAYDIEFYPPVTVGMKFTSWFGRKLSNRQGCRGEALSTISRRRSDPVTRSVTRKMMTRFSEHFQSVTSTSTERRTC